MKSVSLDKEILRLSLPAVITNITVPLLSLSDTAISGHLDDISCLGAIAAGGMMFHTSFWLFGFLRMGTAGLTAQAFGRNDLVKIRTVFSQSFLMAILCGLMIFAFHRPIGSVLLDYISPDTGVELKAMQYYSITMCCAPAVLGMMSINGWFFGMQTTLYPMIISIFTNLLNIVLSLSLVFLCGMGFAGVAWGTAISNWAGLLLSLILAIKFKGFKYLHASRSEIADWRMLKRFFSVNSDIFVRSALIMSISLSVTAFGARQGNLVLATNAVMMQFFLLFSYFMDGIAFTAEALCGRFYGANDKSMLTKSIRHILIWGGAVMALFFLMYAFGQDRLAALITSEKAVLENIKDYSIWLTLMPLLTVLAFIFDGIFIGLTATRKMLVATTMATVIFYTVALWHPDVSPSAWEYPSNGLLWTAFLAYLLTRGLVLGLMTPPIIKSISRTSKIQPS